MSSKKLDKRIQVIKMMPAFAAYRNVGCTACVNGKKIWALANPLCTVFSKLIQIGQLVKPFTYLSGEFNQA